MPHFLSPPMEWHSSVRMFDFFLWNPFKHWVLGWFGLTACDVYNNDFQLTLFRLSRLELLTLPLDVCEAV
jgi:hypothetical protein